MSRSETVSTKYEQIAELAKRMPNAAMWSLSHHMDEEWLREAYRRTRKDGATGIDGRTAEEYARDLEANLESLVNRAHSGEYRAPPVRRVHIPKGNGQTRPLGIPTFEDKVLQRAVAMLLEAVYEQDFLDCSYGFRPGRSAHQALGKLRDTLMDMRGGWVLEVDIRTYFDSIDHKQLREVLRQRIGDGVVLRLIGKWLNAGVMERGEVKFPESGTPQGGVISPMLANIFLHTVLDVWFESQVKPVLRGRAELVRFADDFVMAFEREDDARRVHEVLPKRFAKYGLELHPDKTHLLPFKRPPYSKRTTVRRRAQRNHEPRSRMRESRTSGSVGGPGGNARAYPTAIPMGRDRSGIRCFGLCVDMRGFPSSASRRSPSTSRLSALRPRG